MNLEVINTEDGSKTIYITELNETYHSKFGAINEAEHVFIKNGLKRIKKTDIKICEIGYGTGLNALLSIIYANNNNLTIRYTAFEKFPLTKSITDQLNYGELCKNDKLFKQINTLAWNKIHKISENVFFSKIKADILNNETNLPNNVDIIYFDAFAPSKQIEMWNVNLFSRLYKALSNEGILTTYASAGVVKQSLKQAGFSIKRLAGPKGKFHMILAYKTID